MPVRVPASHRDLLERPLFCALGTTRPDGAPQVNPMWFLWDGERILMTHTTRRRKYANLAADPRASVLIFDPENPYRYLELRGRLIDVEPDPEARFFDRLAERYGSTARHPDDAPDRVVLVIDPETVSTQ